MIFLIFFEISDFSAGILDFPHNLYYHNRSKMIFIKEEIHVRHTGNQTSDQKLR